MVNVSLRRLRLSTMSWLPPAPISSGFSLGATGRLRCEYPGCVAALLLFQAPTNSALYSPRYQCRPVLFHEDGKLIMNFGRAPLLGSAAHPRKSRLPTLNGQQIEALDAIEAIARATEFQFATQAGDIHFINNLSVLHRRDGFVNDGASQRHLVRMRLRSSSLGWSIPSSLSREWFDAFERQSDKVWHIEPMPEHFAPLRKHPN